MTLNLPLAEAEGGPFMEEEPIPGGIRPKTEVEGEDVFNSEEP
jgi:hypothetical protein